MAEQEDVEGQLRWRVEAEVRLATEAAQQAHAQQEAALRREISQLKVKNSGPSMCSKSGFSIPLAVDMRCCLRMS